MNPVDIFFSVVWISEVVISVVVFIDRCYIALFSVREQTHSALVTCVILNE